MHDFISGFCILSTGMSKQIKNNNKTKLQTAYCQTENEIWSFILFLRKLQVLLKRWKFILPYLVSSISFTMAVFPYFGRIVVKV